ncbi:MAG: DNA primase [Flavobacteriales bacterium]|jgi:DNA primase|nr:DNA primase [Flavobacteriales bacterium]MBT7480786.1 DNA primase [Flavobacteriales bacterium]
MIPKETIDKIFEAALIEEVVKDFVHDLKKKGTGYWACCPFHNEKTPSFSVSPVKGIYKCFGCGKGGNSVSFVMDHDKISYPEALKYLANKYNIEIEEKELTSGQIDISKKKEGVFLVSTYANKFFQEQLWETEEGKLIALSYFKQRGFSEEVIKKFQLGYSPKQKDVFTKQALKDSYQKEFLEESGLSFINEKGVVDRFRERVLFPIHNFSGKVLGFGGRSLDPKNKAKYLNSPENPIYHKSKVLYGFYFAKKSVSSKDNCFIVEGYTDVISLFQSGVENVVSASGTALSTEQINLIGRFSKNITILFDGDDAGLNASFKSIDLILSEGMNVQIVMFPEGEDPDSYAQKLSQEDFHFYLEKNATDFITFKSKILNEKSKGNPAKRVEMIKDIAKSISVIPDRLTRSEYNKISSGLLKIKEEELFQEINKIRNSSKGKFVTQNTAEKTNIAKSNSAGIQKKPHQLEDWEKEILRLLFCYGDEILEFEDFDEKVKVSDYIFLELEQDNIKFSNQFYSKILKEYQDLMSENGGVNIKFFTHHESGEYQSLAIDFVSHKYNLSENWERGHQIFTLSESDNLEKTISKAILSLKQSYLKKEILKVNEKLKNEETDPKKLLLILTKLNKVLFQINKTLGRES